MNEEIDVLTYFKQEIDGLAKLEEEKILNETKMIIDETLQEYKLSAKADSEYVLKHKKDEVRSTLMLEISRINNEKNIKLNKRRSELTDLVFEELSNRVLKHTSSQEYIMKLNQKIHSLLSPNSLSKYILFIKKEDQERLEQFPIEIVVSEEIKIGGFMLENKENKTLINETYDNKIEEEKEWFYLNSEMFLNNKGD